jgi:phosphoglucomutase
VFQQPNYTENFVQAILSSIPSGSAGSILVVGGDGRYYGKEAIQIIIRLAAGNQVGVGQLFTFTAPPSQSISHVVMGLSSDWVKTGQQVDHWPRRNLVHSRYSLLIS